MPLVYAPMPVNGDQTQSAQDCVVMTALPFTPTDYLIRAIRCASAMTLTFDTPLKTGRTAVFAAGGDAQHHGNQDHVIHRNRDRH